MTENEIFHALFNGGNYSLPYLIKLHHDVAGDLFFINNNEAVTFEGNTYNVSNFEYTPPDNKGSGGSLSLSAIDNSLVEWVENADEHYTLEIIGVLVSAGNVQRVRGYRHFHGSISYGSDMKVEFSLEGDDRQQMTFNVYVYDTDNNRGNT